MKNQRLYVVVTCVLLLAFSAVVLLLPADDEVDPSDYILQLEIGAEGPEQFALYQQQIRAEQGDQVGYAVNYRFEEWEKASKAAKRPATKLKWQEQGPGNSGGRTRALIADPDDPTLQTWYAGAVSGGVWKTTALREEGNYQRWAPLTDHLPSLGVSALAMAESNHDVMYMGTGEGFFNADAVVGSGIFKSTDRGHNWTHLASTMVNANFRYVNRIAVDPRNEDIVLAATNNGIYRTVDGGWSWIRVYQSEVHVYDLKVHPGNADILFAAQFGEAVLRSVDGGQTWHTVFDASDKHLGRMEVAIAPSDPAVVYFSADSRSGSDLYRSIDGGEAWERVEDVSPDGPIDWLRSQGRYDQTLAVHPFSPDTVYLGGINLWKTYLIDSTATRRTELMYEYFYEMHVDFHNIVLIPIDSTSNDFSFTVANDGGVFWSEDQGNTWQGTHFWHPANGYNTIQFYSVDKRPGADEYVGGAQDHGAWVKSAEICRIWACYTDHDWTLAGPADGFDAEWHDTDDQIVLIAFQANILHRSTQGGIPLTWEPSTNGLEDSRNANAQFVTSLANSKDAPDVVFTMSRRGIWRSDDFGENWTLIPINSEWGAYGSGKVRISLANPNIVWGGYLLDNTGPITGALHVSTDQGMTFNPVAVPEIAPQAVISGLATHPHEDSTAYAIYSVAAWDWDEQDLAHRQGRPKILRTTDLGQTWTDLSGFAASTDGESTNGFPDVAVYDLLVLPDSPDNLWVGTEIGLFVSGDNGASWTYSDNGLPAVAIWRMRIVDDQILVATHGRGVWTVSIGDALTATQEANTLELPSTVQLKQNYPNPFSSETTIRFALSEYAHVTLTVFDVTGREVATLADRSFGAGEHELTWNAAGQASGTYFYRLETGNGGAHTQTMTVVQ